jgi:hypothetical protein
MSLKGSCWDNACAENFFGTLKREQIYHCQYRTRAEATQEIFEYMEVFYNRQRRHSTLGYDSPAEFERGRQWLNQVSTELGKVSTQAACASVIWGSTTVKRWLRIAQFMGKVTSPQGSLTSH